MIMHHNRLRILLCSIGILATLRALKMMLIEFGSALFRCLVPSVLVLATLCASGQTPARYNIYAGNTHSHTSNTWSHGEQYGKPPADAAAKKKSNAKALKKDWQNYQGPPSAHFARAKGSGYDFYITDDHSQEAVFQPVSPTNAAWLAAKRQAAGATDRDFVALAGYEHSENNGPNGTGHINVINSSEYLNALPPDVDLPYLYKWLKTAPPNGEGFVVASFNHPAPNGYNDWTYCDPQVADVITLLEVINSNSKVHYKAFVNALDKGWKVSPVCGNDNHGFWGIKNHTSRTFVLAATKTKAAILEAMKNRRTYASVEGNIQCRYTVNGAIMGSTLHAPKSFSFDISVCDPDTGKPEDRITKIDIVKDGGVVAQTHTPEPAHSVAWKPTIEDSASKYFFVRVWNSGGGDAPGAKPAEPIAWLAPVWTGR